jgi:nucleoside-diphosphate-sugar epimerase
MAKSILITGAGGFIGSHLVEYALTNGWEVWAGIRRTTSHVWLSDPRIHFIELPYARPDLLREVLRQHKVQHGSWEVIIHNMGVTKCPRSEDFERVNCTYLQHLITALRSCGMIPSRFVLMSSLSAFGAIHEEDGAPIRLSDVPRPNTAYGRSKLHAAEYLMAQVDVPHLIFYPTGVYGPRDEDYYLMFRTVQAGFDFIPGLKPQRITFIYVRDLVSAIFRAIESGVSYRRYIVAEGRSYSSTDFRRYIQAELHKRLVLPVRVPLCLLRLVNYTAGSLAALMGRASTLNADKYRIMAQRNWECDITPLSTELQFTPQWSLERGVAETLRWYRANSWL